MPMDMKVNFSNTNPVAEILRLQPPSLLVLTQSGISINLSSGEVIIPENLELSAASREFWNNVRYLAQTRIAELETQLMSIKRNAPVEELRRPADEWEGDICGAARKLRNRADRLEREGK